MTGRRVQRSVRILRRTGDSPPVLQEWGCRIDVLPGGLDVRIAEPAGPAGPDLHPLLGRLHRALSRRLPQALGGGLVVEVGRVHTQAWADGRPRASSERGYALALAADAVVLLSEDPAVVPAVPWQGVCAAADVDPALPVVLGPSAVLALAAGALELGEPAALPDWLSVEPTHRSPYPPQDDLGDALGLSGDEPDGELLESVAWWGAHTERWLRPMWTTRSRRSQYRVRTCLPAGSLPPAVLRIESLVSLDTLGRTWQASLSVGADGERVSIPAPVRLDAAAGDLLRSARAEAEPGQPAVDRDPIDGACFGWAPGLVTGLVAAEVGLRAMG